MSTVTVDICNLF